MTQHGINLGCGTVILPCERPAHHGLIPETLYSDPAITWDNVDWNAVHGVTQVVNLFDYPWRNALGNELPDNTYDVAIAAHLCEHIPHYIVERGAFVPHHAEFQDGWFAWFAQLWRILKPGGKAYILVPYAWSHAGISDPTHTRYVTPSSFNYFDAPHNDSPFTYRVGSRWVIDLNATGWQVHALALDRARRLEQSLPVGAGLDTMQHFFHLANTNINMMAEFMVTMEAVK
jgi:SAM-dependent methyltransferase